MKKASKGTVFKGVSKKKAKNNLKPSKALKLFFDWVICSFDFPSLITWFLGILTLPWSQPLSSACIEDSLGKDLVRKTGKILYKRSAEITMKINAEI